jgi:hypothetical protein
MCGRAYRAEKTSLSYSLSALFGMLPFLIFPVILLSGLPYWVKFGAAPLVYLGAAIWATIATQRWVSPEQAGE